MTTIFTIQIAGFKPIKKADQWKELASALTTNRDVVWTGRQFLSVKDFEEQETKKKKRRESEIRVCKDEKHKRTWIEYETESRSLTLTLLEGGSKDILLNTLKVQLGVLLLMAQILDSPDGIHHDPFHVENNCLYCDKEIVLDLSSLVAPEYSSQTLIQFTNARMTLVYEIEECMREMERIRERYCAPAYTYHFTKARQPQAIIELTSEDPNYQILVKRVLDLEKELRDVHSEYNEAQGLTGQAADAWLRILESTIHAVLCDSDEAADLFCALINLDYDTLLKKSAEMDVPSHEDSTLAEICRWGIQNLQLRQILGTADEDDYGILLSVTGELALFGDDPHFARHLMEQDPMGLYELGSLTEEIVIARVLLLEQAEEGILPAGMKLEILDDTIGMPDRQTLFLAFACLASCTSYEVDQDVIRLFYTPERMKLFERFMAQLPKAGSKDIGLYALALAGYLTIASKSEASRMADVVQDFIKLLQRPAQINSHLSTWQLQAIGTFMMTVMDTFEPERHNPLSLPVCEVVQDILKWVKKYVAHYTWHSPVLLQLYVTAQTLLIDEWTMSTNKGAKALRSKIDLTEILNNANQARFALPRQMDWLYLAALQAVSETGGEISYRFAPLTNPIEQMNIEVKRLLRFSEDDDLQSHQEGLLISEQLLRKTGYSRTALEILRKLWLFNDPLMNMPQVGMFGNPMDPMDIDDLWGGIADSAPLASMLADSPEANALRAKMQEMQEFYTGQTEKERAALSRSLLAELTKLLDELPENAAKKVRLECAAFALEIISTIRILSEADVFLLLDAYFSIYGQLFAMNLDDLARRTLEDVPALFEQAKHNKIHLRREVKEMQDKLASPLRVAMAHTGMDGMEEALKSAQQALVQLSPKKKKKTFRPSDRGLALNIINFCNQFSYLQYPSGAILRILKAIGASSASMNEEERNHFANTCADVFRTFTELGDDYSAKAVRKLLINLDCSDKEGIQHLLHYMDPGYVLEHEEIFSADPYTFAQSRIDYFLVLMLEAMPLPDPAFAQMFGRMESSVRAGAVEDWQIDVAAMLENVKDVQMETSVQERRKYSYELDEALEQLAQIENLTSTPLGLLKTRLEVFKVLADDYNSYADEQEKGTPYDSAFYLLLYRARETIENASRTIPKLADEPAQTMLAAAIDYMIALNALSRSRFYIVQKTVEKLLNQKTIAEQWPVWIRQHFYLSLATLCLAACLKGNSAEAGFLKTMAGYAHGLWKAEPLMQRSTTDLIYLFLHLKQVLKKHPACAQPYLAELQEWKKEIAALMESRR